ncbi:MAG: GNAT family N-acetyltransferase [Oscillatoriaceae cyanobacterium Prado104]|jgi:GNAT superfamily N-acetyltransferase|nr:GNAT family N-acetyltransferase [Oscillatoriaceae cyanobacterium Prado104]
MGDFEIKIREAELADLESIVSFIRQKSEFDGAINGFVATADKLQKTLFCESPFVRVLLAEVAGKTVGFAMFYASYSSLLAQPCLWLDDLFVQAPMRGMGIGSALLKRLAQIAESTNCGRIEWTVNVGNAPGIAFYQKQGARILERIRVCRIEGEGIGLLAGK